MSRDVLCQQIGLLATCLLEREGVFFSFFFAFSGYEKRSVEIRLLTLTRPLSDPRPRCAERPLLFEPPRPGGAVYTRFCLCIRTLSTSSLREPSPHGKINSQYKFFPIGELPWPLPTLGPCKRLAPAFTTSPPTPYSPHTHINKAFPNRTPSLPLTFGPHQPPHPTPTHTPSTSPPLLISAWNPML